MNRDEMDDIIRQHAAVSKHVQEVAIRTAERLRPQIEQLERTSVEAVINAVRNQSTSLVPSVTLDDATYEAALRAVASLSEQALQVSLQAQQNVARAISPETMARLSALAGLQLPRLDASRLAALGAAVREEGAADGIEEASAHVEGLDPAADAAANDPSATEASIDPADVRLGVQALYWLVALAVVVGISTDNGVLSWLLERLIEVVEVKGLVEDAANRNKSRRRRGLRD